MKRFISVCALLSVLLWLTPVVHAQQSSAIQPGTQVRLTMANGLVQAAATAGVPVITADFATSHFTGVGVDVDADGGDDGPASAGDLDDLLLS